jgi:hypothetical protein
MVEHEVKEQVKDGKDVESGPNLSAQNEARFRSAEELIEEEQRCVRCDALLALAVCGRRNPCPFCGFPYPLGDCSDLAEN